MLTTNMLQAMFEEKLKKIQPETSKMVESADSSKESYPYLSLDSKALEDIKDWEVDGEYYLVMKVKQKDKSMHTVDGEEKYCAGFDILEIGVLDGEQETPEEDSTDTTEQDIKDKYKKP